jgi:hypothetical protein
VPHRAAAQNFQKVVDIVVEVESSLKEMIAKEATQRKSEIASLKAEIQEIRTTFTHLSSATNIASNGNQLVALGEIGQRLDRVERKVETLPASPDVSKLASQLSLLITELKKNIEESKKTTATYSIAGQIRHRSEIDGRNFDPAARAMWFNLLRSRLSVAVTPLPDVNVFVQVQDARLFGGENPGSARGTTDGSAKALDFHQAYFSVGKLFGTSLNVKVGRQELLYGNERLIGTLGWSNVGRAFDGGVLSYTTESLSADMLALKLVGSQTGFTWENLRGLYSTLRFFQPHLVDAFVLFDDNTSEVPKGVDAGAAKLTRTTIGTYARGKLQLGDYELEMIYQNGKMALNDSSARADIRAYLFSGSVGYTLNPESKLRIGLLYTRTSGDESPKDQNVGTFNSLFATGHKFFGYMDYFPGVLSEYGLQDFALLTSLNITGSVSCTADFHHFALERAAMLTEDPGEKVHKRSVGQELDLTTTVKYNANFSFIVGASAFVPDRVMRNARGSATTYWVYVMTQVSF